MVIDVWDVCRVGSRTVQCTQRLSFSNSCAFRAPRRAVAGGIAWMTLRGPWMPWKERVKSGQRAVKRLETIETLWGSARVPGPHTVLFGPRLEPIHQPERAILKLSEHQRRRVNFVFGGELKNNNTDYHRRSVTQNFGDARTIGCACQNFNTKTFRKKIVFNFEKL